MLTLWLERYRAYIFAAIAAGADIDLDKMLREFDVWLHAPLEEVDPERDELEKVLGVGRWRR